MQTILLLTDTPMRRAAAVARAAEMLAAGEPVALPTETVYGLAADATRPEAVAKVFEAKERPFFDPLIVHLPSTSWLPVLTEVGDAAAAIVERLTERFWPGPLTLVLPRRTAVPDIVTAGLPTVAVRMSAHPVFREVLAAFGKPLAAPSANRFGRISPTSGAHVMAELAGRIPLVIDAGPTTHGVESTIVAVEAGRLRVLRDGPITREELVPFGEVVSEHTAADAPEAPGQLKSHYAPRTPLRLIASREGLAAAPGQRIGLLAWGAAPAEGFDVVEVLSPRRDLREAAANLFAALRRLDEAGLDLIVAEPVPEQRLGVAIMDRLRKAAAQT